MTPQMPPQIAPQMPLRRTGEPTWAWVLLVVICSLIGALTGGLAGFLAGEASGSDRAASGEVVFRPSYPLRGLSDAIEEDLGMSTEQWFDESMAVTAAVSASLHGGIMPTQISGTGIVDTAPYWRSAEHASEAMQILPPEARLVPERQVSGPWMCSPGVDVMVINHNLPEPTHTRAALTASHCLTDLPVSGTDHPIVDVLGHQIAPTDSRFPSDTSGVSHAGSDVALTTRSVAASRLADLQGSVGVVPMVPGMKVCAHGNVSGWRCGEVLPHQRSSVEGVAYQAVAIPSASGDSGGRIIFGHHAAGVTSAYSYIADENGRGEQITNSWAGSLFDTTVIARERGFEILVMR